MYFLAGSKEACHICHKRILKQISPKWLSSKSVLLVIMTHSNSQIVFCVSAQLPTSLLSGREEETKEVMN